MWRVPILSKKEDERCDKDAIRDLHSLPPFYMSDYTVLGIAVEEVERTLEVLKKGGYTLDRANPAYPAEAVLAGTVMLAGLLELLQKNGIEFAFGDIVGSVYQG